MVNNVITSLQNNKIFSHLQRASVSSTLLKLRISLLSDGVLMPLENSARGFISLITPLSVFRITFPTPRILEHTSQITLMLAFSNVHTIHCHVLLFIVIPLVGRSLIWPTERATTAPVLCLWKQINKI